MKTSIMTVEITVMKRDVVWFNTLLLRVHIHVYSIIILVYNIASTRIVQKSGSIIIQCIQCWRYPSSTIDYSFLCFLFSLILYLYCTCTVNVAVAVAVSATVGVLVLLVGIITCVIVRVVCPTACNCCAKRRRSTVSNNVEATTPSGGTTAVTENQDNATPAPIVQPSAPIAQPSAPIAQPSAPITQPSAPITQPSAPIVPPLLQQEAYKDAQFSSQVAPPSYTASTAFPTYTSPPPQVMCWWLLLQISSTSRTLC